MEEKCVYEVEPPNEHSESDDFSADYGSESGLECESDFIDGCNLSGDDSSDDDLSPFADVLSLIDPAALTEYALHIRQRLLSRQAYDASKASSATIQCHCNSGVMPGSHSVCLPVVFSDGMKWLFKVPGNGTSELWDGQSAQALRSEALRMRFIANHTCVPIPTVLDFDDTCNNPLNCPFILECVEGIDLWKAWSQGSSPRNSVPMSLESLRERALRDIVNAIVQLSRISYEKSGVLVFDRNGCVTEVSPARTVDYAADHTRAKKMEPRVATMYRQMRPCRDAKPYSVRRLALDKASITVEKRGQTKLLRHFIDWFLEEEDSARKDFVLSHPDLNWQNVVVGEDGLLHALISWDGVAIVPSSIGSEEYLLFLTQDRDSTIWDWDLQGGRIQNPQGQSALSPRELEIYQGIYRQAMTRARSKQRCPKKSSILTRKPPLARTLWNAANKPWSLPRNVDLVFTEIASFTAGTNFENKMVQEVEFGELEELRYPAIRQCINDPGQRTPAFPLPYTAGDIFLNHYAETSELEADVSIEIAHDTVFEASAAKELPTSDVGTSEYKSKHESDYDAAYLSMPGAWLEADANNFISVTQKSPFTQLLCCDDSLVPTPLHTLYYALIILTLIFTVFECIYNILASPIGLLLTLSLLLNKSFFPSICLTIPFI